jgi:hypothetical protein
MNKIVNELFNRAGGWTEVCDVSGEEILTYNEHLDPEKFAELIVKECAQEFDNTYMEGGKTMGAYIREKFGVEE